MSKVFISYVHEDWDTVRVIVRNFKRNGIGVWIDKAELAGGQRWKKKIRDAIRSGLYFISVHSKQRADKEKTYSSEELVIAIEELKLRPYDKEWLIPVRLDDHEIEDRPIGGGETYFDLHIEDLRDLSIGIPKLLKIVGVDEPDVELEETTGRNRDPFGGPLGTAHAALRALQGIQSEFGVSWVDRKKIERRYGENSITDLVGLGLVLSRRPKIRLVQEYDDLPLALKVAVAKQPSFQVAASVLSKDFNSSGWQIGHEIGEYSGRDWSDGTKTRYGNSYRGWAVMFYPNFKKPEVGENGYLWRRTIEGGTKGHGRRKFITEDILKEISKMKAEGINISQMAKKLGCVPQVIYNWKRANPEAWHEL
ncbi:MAG: TIR domain-containing protein [Pseudomonadota bacterium]